MEGEGEGEGRRRDEGGAPDSIDLYEKTRWRSPYNSSSLNNILVLSTNPVQYIAIVKRISTTYCSIVYLQCIVAQPCVTSVVLH